MSAFNAAAPQSSGTPGPVPALHSAQGNPIHIYTDVETRFLQGVVLQPAPAALELLDLAEESYFYNPPHRTIRRHIITLATELTAAGETTSHVDHNLLLSRIHETGEHQMGGSMSRTLVSVISSWPQLPAGYYQCKELIPLLRDAHTRRMLDALAQQISAAAASGDEIELEMALHSIQQVSRPLGAFQGACVTAAA